MLYEVITGLLLEDRHLVGEGCLTVFSFGDIIIAKASGDLFRLAAFAGAVGTGVHLDKTDDVRVHRTDKIDDASQVGFGSLEKAGIRDR